MPGFYENFAKKSKNKPKTAWDDIKEATSTKNQQIEDILSMTEPEKKKKVKK